jgi:hypothetical protein
MREIADKARIETFPAAIDLPSFRSAVDAIFPP